jgi:hypothetical protein
MASRAFATLLEYVDSAAIVRVQRLCMWIEPTSIHMLWSRVGHQARLRLGWGYLAIQ